MPHERTYTPPKVGWLACDLKTGLVLTELPLTASGPVKRSLSTIESDTVTFAVADKATPPDWADVVVPGRTMIVLTLDDTPVQAWTLDSDVVGEAAVPLGVQSLEACLDSVNVPDLDAYDLDQAETLAELMAPTVANFGFEVTWSPVGQTAERDYYADDDATVLSAANALNELRGGPEWRIVPVWEDGTHRRIRKLIQIGPRVGDVRPDVIFDRAEDGSGTVETYTRTRRRAATRVTGVLDGSGSARIMGTPQTSPLVAQGWSVWEERISPTGLGEARLSEVEERDLTALAAARIRQRPGYLTTWTLSARDIAPRPGAEYGEGDTVYLELAPSRFDPIGTGGRRIGVRVRGWELDVPSGIATLVVWDPDDQTGAGASGTGT